MWIPEWLLIMISIIGISYQLLNAKKWKMELLVIAISFVVTIVLTIFWDCPVWGYFIIFLGVSLATDIIADHFYFKKYGISFFF